MITARKDQGRSFKPTPAASNHPINHLIKSTKRAGGCKNGIRVVVGSDNLPLARPGNPAHRRHHIGVRPSVVEDDSFNRESG